jgi:hypothetical protein
MKFEDFKATTGTDNTIILWADAPARRVRFLIGTSILAEQLGVKNPVHVDASIKRCEAQREKIEAACRRAFKRQPADFVSLTAVDFVAEPTPPSP